MYLFNEQSQVPDLEEILPAGNFDQTYFVYPKNIIGSGYILNLETRSFGRLPSENLLTKVEFYPADYSNLQVFKGKSLQGAYSIQNNLKILNVQKYGTWGYKIDIQGNSLKQLTVDSLSHVKVDSWANGWLVPSNQPNNRSTIYLIFWPQFLEWGGIVMGAITLLVLLRVKNR
jgi:hypothetical protein